MVGHDHDHGLGTDEGGVSDMAQGKLDDEAQGKLSAASIASGDRPYAHIRVEDLVDVHNEEAAVTALPKPQRIDLSGTASASSSRARASSDRQCIARRAATALKARSASHTQMLVQNIGDRAQASSTTPSVSAKTRMEALRERIRAKQGSNPSDGS